MKSQNNLNKSPNTVWHKASITKEHRELLNGHKSFVLWFTGLSGAGKSTIAHAVEEKLYQMGCRTFVLDGDNVRHGLCSDIAFSEKDRRENIRRIGEVVKLFVEAGIITLAAFISPFREDRQKIRSLFSGSDFIEIYCYCPLEVCIQRDKKGLYQKAIKGEIKEYTGISSPYETPESADLKFDTNTMTLQECVDAVVNYLVERKLISVPFAINRS